MDRKPQENLPNRLLRLRTRLGLSQPEMAQAMGVPAEALLAWESGSSQPPASAWAWLLRFDGIDGDPAAALSGLAATSAGPPAVAMVRAIDFGADPEVVRVVVEGERLAHGHLFNHTFATEVSMVDPLPHQRIAVYEHMLPQPRLRFLLADDAGAGKTIMTGLYVRESLTRRTIRRVLIVTPAGLIGNWSRELRNLFQLRFRIITSADARKANPFVGPDSDL